MPHPRQRPHPARSVLKIGVLGLVALLSLAGAGVAQTTAPAYSAEAHYIGPDGSTSTGKVIKSGSNMRLEYNQGGQPIIQIIRRAEGVMYVLDPASRTWYEVQGAPDPNAGAPGYVPPCEQSAVGTTCRFIGNETTSGINAEKWEIGQQGRATSTILWDGVRQRALRQDYADGSMMELKFVAMEQLAGRRAEHWRINVTMPGQPAAEGQWYYDPELRVELREELPSGELRSLENIVVGAVGPTAFQIPDGWTQIAAPQAPN